MPQLRQLRASRKAKIAVSLHATTDEIRSWIAPINRKHNLGELMGALEEMFPKALATTPGCSDDFVILEYVMLAVRARGVGSTSYWGGRCAAGHGEGPCWGVGVRDASCRWFTES